MSAESSTARFALRPIEARDDAAVEAIIRAVMPEFRADGPGFALHDPEVARMSAAYAAHPALYLVLERGGRVLGGGGIAPLRGGPPGVCELQKMYFLPEARGHGQGERLVRELLERARERGFTRCYLETLTGMDAAMRLYERLGFARLAAPLGATGHCSCDRWYALDLGAVRHA